MNKIVKQYVKLNDVEYFFNSYYCDSIVENLLYFEVYIKDTCIGLIFKSQNLKIKVDEEVIYGK